MKTARFSVIVKKCGDPESHLVLTDPAKDRTLQTALKSHRVMTVYQSAVGNKTDRGEVGFSLGRSRQFLIFPKSLKDFEGISVVGIKYDLLDSTELPKSRQAAKAQPPKKSKHSNSPAPAKKSSSPRLKADNVVAFKQATPPEDDEGENEEVEDIKKQVRHAMAVLEQGKQVAAFNLLKRIVES